MVEHFPSTKLHQASGTTGAWTASETIMGIASHDLYHAGQIQLLKHLARG